MFFNLLSKFSFKIFPTILFLIFVTPVIIILSSLFFGYSENWFHLYNYVLSEYIINSIFLILGVSFFVTVIGVVSSWLVTHLILLERIFSNGL